MALVRFPVDARGREEVWLGRTGTTLGGAPARLVLEAKGLFAAKIGVGESKMLGILGRRWAMADRRVLFLRSLEEKVISQNLINAEVVESNHFGFIVPEGKWI